MHRTAAAASPSTMTTNARCPSAANTIAKSPAATSQCVNIPTSNCARCQSIPATIANIRAVQLSASSVRRRVHAATVSWKTARIWCERRSDRTAARASRREPVRLAKSLCRCEWTSHRRPFPSSSLRKQFDLYIWFGTNNLCDSKTKTNKQC